MISASSSVDKGEGFDNIVDSSFVHIDTWLLLQDCIRGLHSLEYEDVPRGRVLFLKRQKKFRVLMDKTLFQPSIKAAIRKVFRLPKARTEFKTDDHYTTDPAALDLLFHET